MASELTVQTLRGPTSGANANTILIPSGQVLDASAGFVAPAGSVIQVAQADTSTPVTLAVGTGIAINTINFTPKYSNSIIQVTISHGQTTKNSGAGTATWLSCWVGLDGTNTEKIRTGAIGYPEAYSDHRYTFSVTGQIPSWAGQKTLTHNVSVGSSGSSWTISHQNAPTGMFVMEIAQ